MWHVPQIQASSYPFSLSVVPTHWPEATKVPLPVHLVAGWDATRIFLNSL